MPARSGSSGGAPDSAWPPRRAPSWSRAGPGTLSPWIGSGSPARCGSTVSRSGREESASMAGVFGVVSRTTSPRVSHLLSAMARHVRHHAWYKESSYADEKNGLGLGRVSLGLINAARQPVANEDGTRLAVLE